MGKLSSIATKAMISVVVLAIVAVGAYYVFLRGSSTKTVTADFPEAVGVYVGTPVRILGVEVGSVTSVTPGPSFVKVTMEYDATYRIRASDAEVDEVANSLVSDRYLNLGPLISANDPAPALESGATVAKTGAPAELDDIYAALDKLSVALGPSGANKGGQQDGALSTLLKVSAANLKGNGAALGNSITKLAAAAQTLSDRKDGLFGTVKNLQKFTAALKSSDGQVRLFNTQLAQVAGDLAAERTDLGAALQQLGLALNDVKSFISQNQAKFHTDIKGLETITGVLAKEKSSINEALAIAPVALANITHAYYPQYGAIGTRSNLASLTDGLTASGLTSLTCSALNTVLGQATGSTGVLAGLGLGSTISKTLGSVCPASASTSSAQSKQVVSTALNGGVAPGMLIGSGS